MSFWRPRSVLQLVLVGFLTALAPLCLAILYTVDTLQDVAASDRAVTRQVIEVTRLGEEIQSELLEMERHARQYLALFDPELATLFEGERTLVLEQLRILQARMGPGSTEIFALQRSIERLDLASAQPENAAMVQAVEQGPGREAGQARALTPMVEYFNQNFQTITEQRRALQHWLQLGVDRQLETNAAQADTVINTLVLQLTLLAVTTLALLLFFSYWINKPVQDLTQEIHKLGTAGLSHTIEISGPQEMAELGRKLEWLRQSLHANDQQKEQFLRHISHELKTPLSSLREGADLLAEQVTGRLSRQQLEVVEIVRNNAIELQRLIENLLDYNQLPRQDLTFEEIALDQLWGELLRNYRITMQQKNLHLATHGTVSSWVCDRYKLKTTLDNLLSNAINYTPEGGRIDIAWYANDAILTMDVANSGVPIPAEDAEKVFEPFFQSSAKRTGPMKGSGIGLSVARECIEVQGGTLSLASHGTLPICFRLICPAH